VAGAFHYQSSSNFHLTMLAVLLVFISTVGTLTAKADNALVNGINEFETGLSHDGDDLNATSPGISKFELQFNSPVSRPFGALLRLKHEVDEDEVDEGYLRYRFGADNRFAILAGKSYTPFGQFESSLITDPMTLTLGESRMQGLMFEADWGDWTTSVFASPVSSDKGSEVTSGVGLNYHWGEDWRGYGFGLEAISNIAIADGIQSAAASPGMSARMVPALAAHAIYASGNNRITVEAVAATEPFASGDLAFKGVGAKPDAVRAEYARRFQFLNKPFTAATSLQYSHEALALELPQTRFAAGVSAELSSNASLALELLHDTAYPLSVGGSGKTNDTLTLQFAVSF
jgi:hypothetical protein